MREFHIETCPFNAGQKLYYRSKVQFNPGLTVLVGCNGSGKSTLLTSLKNELIRLQRKTNKDILCIDYDDRGMDGSGGLVSKFAFFQRFDLVAQTMAESEGEKIMHGMCEKATHIGHLVHTRRKNGEKPFKELWILLDAVGSGLSIDGILSIKEDLVKVVIEDNPDTDVYFIISTNEYEFAYEEDCLDVTTFNHVRFKTYEEYKKFILKTQEKKQKREERWQKQARVP